MTTRLQPSPEPVRLGQFRLPPAEAIQHAFEGIFQRAWFANQGPLVTELDSSFAGVAGGRRSVCLTNTTIGLALATRALDLRGRIAVPARASAELIQGIAWGGAEPVLVDVNSRTGALDPDALDRCASARSGQPFVALAAVPAAHRPELPEDLLDVAERHQLPMLIDASEVLGTSFRLPEASRAIACYSFSSHHIVGAGEGSVAVTHDESLAERLRWLRSFHGGRGDGLIQPRLNGKMAEAPAALILAGLAELSNHRAANADLFARYRDRLAEVPGASLIECPEGQESNHEALEVELESPEDALRVVTNLASHGIESARPLSPRELTRLGSRHAGEAAALKVAGPWPVAEELAARRVRLPLGSQVQPATVDRIVTQVARTLKQAAPMRRLAS